MNKTTFRSIQSFLSLITFIVIFASLYLEYSMHLTPCPLCIMQRICVFILLILMGLSLRTIKKAHFVCLLQMFFAGAGLFFSVRQLWLQSLPPGKIPACMPGLDVLIHYFPWQTVAKALFWGAGDCAEVSWTLYGISMPGWAAMYFLFAFVVSLFLFVQTLPQNQRFD